MKRVAATMDFLDVLLPLAGKNAQAIKDARSLAKMDCSSDLFTDRLDPRRQQELHNGL